MECGALDSWSASSGVSVKVEYVDCEGARDKNRRFGDKSVMFEMARQAIRRFPRLKKALLIIWWQSRHALWVGRNIITKHAPVVIPVTRQLSIRLYPEGQIAELMWGTEFERAEREFIASYLRPGMRVVNVGANIGLYVVMASGLVGANGEVHAFEPSGSTFERLSCNIYLNSCANVRANRMALSDQVGQIFLRVDPNNPSADGHRFVQSMDSVATKLSTDEVVDCGTLDDYMISQSDGRGIAPVDVMIIDVEGAELSVLRGGENTIAASPNLVLLLECTHDRTETESLLKTLGFEFFQWDIKGKALRPCRFMDRVLDGDVIATKLSAAIVQPAVSRA